MFVSPIFLVAGSMLVGIPILIHILNRRRFKIVNWAAMDFLLRAMQKNRKRLRFEQMILLVTRCLVLFLLGAALARPMGCEQSTIADLAGRRSGLHVFVIDNSYSMAYEADRPGAKTQLDQAKIIAKALIEHLSSGGECVAVVTAGRPSTAVIATPSYDLKEAEAAIDRIQQSYDGTDEVGALSKARDIANADNKDPNKSLYLIDDSTRVGWETSGDAIKQTAADLAKVYATGITHFNLGKPDEWNHAIVSLKPAESLVTNWFPPDFIADVRGYGSTAGDPKITWFLDGDLQPPGGATAKATEAAAPITTTLHSLAGGIHIISAGLTSDDRLPIDNTRYRVVNVVNQLKVLIVEGERGVGGLGSSGAFLDDALNPPMVGADATPGHKTNSYVSTERISDLELPNKVLTDYRCVCLCGVGQIQEQEAAQLETFVRQGGTLMVFMGDPVTADNYNATLYKHHLLPGPLTRRVTAGIGPNDPPRRFAFDPHGNLHPLLDDFRNFDDSGMNAVEIYNYWQVDIPSDSKAEHVLDFLPPDNAKDQKPDPAITVQALGSGRVLFYATAADPNGEWTTFMAHRAFPAMMHMLLLGTVSAGDEWMNILVDQPVEVPASINLTAAPTLTDSHNIEFPMQQVINAAGQSVYQSKPLAIPGIYSLATGTENFKVAVNVPSDEADIRTISNEQLKKDMGDIDMRLEGDSVPAPSAAANEGLDMGWSVMVIVFMLLAVECLMAMMFGHHRRKAA